MADHRGSDRSLNGFCKLGQEVYAGAGAGTATGGEHHDDDGGGTVEGEFREV